MFFFVFPFIVNIQGTNINSAITVSEVIVYVGTATCFVYFINELTLRCDLPDEQLSAGDFNGQNTERGLPEVVVSPKTNSLGIILEKQP